MPAEVCWSCGSVLLDEAESVPVDREGRTERRLVCEDCGRRQYVLTVGRGVL